jgi:hypothetical protein
VHSGLLTERFQNALFRLAAVLLTGALAWLMFGHLCTAWINDYDEARHGVNAYEMIRSGDYVVNTYQGLPDGWNLKPPLSLWLIALGYRTFGYNAFALSFFSALSGLLAVLAVASWAYRSFGRAPRCLRCWAFAGSASCTACISPVTGMRTRNTSFFHPRGALRPVRAAESPPVVPVARFLRPGLLEKGLHAANVVWSVSPFVGYRPAAAAHGQARRADSACRLAPICLGRRALCPGRLSFFSICCHRRGRAHRHRGRPADADSRRSLALTVFTEAPA